MTNDTTYDVVVLGGGPAGLSGALALGRARRRVLVIDSGAPRNANAAHMHLVLGRDHTDPAELLRQGRAEVSGYGGEIVPDEIVTATGAAGAFRVSLRSGRTARGRRLLIATGLIDELPEVEGLASRWGRDVISCPYCHGYEFRDRRIGVLATGPLTAHQAQMYQQLSDSVTVLAHTGPAPTEAEAAGYAARGILVLPGIVERVHTESDSLVGVRLAGGHLVELDALVVAPRLHARAAFLDSLGLAAVDDPSGMGTSVPTDPRTFRTAVPGVWAAGNVTDLAATVIWACAAGTKAATTIHADLIEEDIAAARAAVGTAA